MWNSLAVVKEMVVMWILSFLIQSFVYLIDGVSFPQEFGEDQNISVSDDQLSCVHLAVVDISGICFANRFDPVTVLFNTFKDCRCS